MNPSYWWECLMLQCNVIWMTMTALLFMTTTSIVLNIENIFRYTGKDIVRGVYE